MQVKKTKLSDTKVRLTIIPSDVELKALEAKVLESINSQVKVPGFRPGKAPAGLVAKNADQAKLQTDFLDAAISQLYVRGVETEKLRPVDQPQVSIKKFVPFSDLEFDAEIEVIGEIKLANYKALKLPKEKAKVTDKEIKAVIDSLAERAAERKEVERVAKIGDEIIIDFSGTDPKTNKPVNGADGKDYPLLLGSQSFIPGFETELIGLKPGSEKSFSITFPKDYGVTALQNKKVSFRVTVKLIKELAIPAIDEKFVEKVSPFKSLNDLKADIKKQLLTENQNKIDGAFENELIQQISLASTVTIPKVLVDQQIERSEQEERQNLAYRGQTWNEHLAEEGVTEEQHRERNRPMAEANVKAGLVLSEIAEQEKIIVTSEEVEIRLQILKGQYPDQAMQSELSKDENRQTIANQILTEKTFKKLIDYTSPKKGK